MNNAQRLSGNVITNKFLILVLRYISLMIIEVNLQSAYCDSR